MGTDKTVLRGKFIALNAYIGTKKDPKSVSFHLKNEREKGKINLQQTRNMITVIRAEISEIISKQ